LQLLGFITYFFELLPFLLCTFFFKKISSTTEGKAFFIYITLYAVIILLVLFFRYYLENRIVTALLKRVAIIIEFALLCNYYYQILVSKRIKRLFYLAVPIFIAVAFYDYYVSVERVISFMPLVIECLFFLVLIIYSFYEKIQYSLSTPIYLSMSFWVSTGFIIYFSGNFFLFLYSKTAIKNDAFKLQYNLIYNFFTIIKDILLSIAVVINSHPQNSKSRAPIHSEMNQVLDSFKLYNK
jgi:hypothetical protein